MDIGSAKIKKEEMEGILHHLIDIKEPHEKYSVYDFQKDAKEKIKEIKARGRIPIIVGGTGLYIKALLYDYEFYPEEELLNKNYDNYSNEELYELLIDLDSLCKDKIHPNNRKRIIRALNYFYLHQQSIKTKKHDKMVYDAKVIGLKLDRNTLYERINKRVDEMINEGLIDEVKTLFDKGLMGINAMKAIGYKELCEYFIGKISLEEAINLIKRNSRRYAKRQYTWFNNQMDVKWFQVNTKDFNKTIEEVINYLK